MTATATNNVVERIRQFNAGRDPERLAQKYQAIADNPFSFLRGTCHLFYEDFPAGDFVENAPAGWLCGDLHLENFGTYKGDNRLTYFDINDFDEGMLAPAHWDLSRFLVSLLVAAESIKVRPAEALALCHCFLDTYASTLSRGDARWVERTTATGMVRNLLSELRKRPVHPCWIAERIAKTANASCGSMAKRRYRLLRSTAKKSSISWKSSPERKTIPSFSRFLMSPDASPAPAAWG